MTTEQVMEEGAASDFIAAAEDMGDSILCDWRKTGYLNPIRHQGLATCCFAFASCGAIEALHHITNKKEGKDRIVLSPQDLYNNLIKNDLEDSYGRTIPDTLEFIMENRCVLDEHCPYEEKYNISEDNRKVKLRIETIVELKLKAIEEEVKVAPVIAQMYWMPDMKGLKGDVIYYTPKDASLFNKEDMHAVVIVGFGELKRKRGKPTKYWIIRNSHGCDWGDGGYAKIDREIYDGKSIISAAWAVRGISLKDRNGVPYEQ